MADRSCRIERFDLTGKSASEKSAICGGTALILFDPRPGDWDSALRLLRSDIERREPGVLATFIRHRQGEGAETARRWIPVTDIRGNRPSVREDDLLRTAREALSDQKPRLLKTSSQESDDPVEWTYVEPAYPLPRLFIAGAGHLGKAVAHLGRLLDFDVTVIDDRPEFANHKNVPDADRFIVGNIEKSVHDCPSGPDSYFVIVTRDHLQDAEALRGCIGRSAGYIGMIGSRRKVDLTRKEFIEREWAKPEDFDKIRAPIGIDIGSRSVQEIALSIAAQLVMVRSGSSPGDGRNQ